MIKAVKNATTVSNKKISKISNFFVSEVTYYRDFFKIC